MTRAPYAGRVSVRQVCVLYVTRETEVGREVLLGRKRTGLGKGKVLAPGGKLEPGERPDEAAIRELAEEVGPGLQITDLRRVGMHEYRFPAKSAWDSHVFVAQHAAGEPTSSTELEAFWVAVDAVPYGEMWSDAQLWLPEVLQGGACGHRYTFADDLESLVAAHSIC